MNLSVVICTHNPKPEIFSKVVSSLKDQSLEYHQWELIVIDNQSATPVSEWVDISWHPSSQIIIEPTLGLSNARLSGVRAANTNIIVFVDDDNILNEDYIQESLKFHNQHPEVGCFGGKSIPEFETPPPQWFFSTGIDLGCQDFGDKLHISNFRSKDFKVTRYPQFAPIGTGMVILKQAFLMYVEEVARDTRRLELGRKGQALTSGEDNDIILTIIKHGFEIAYVPTLQIRHIIPRKRYSQEYLSKMAFESNRSWVKVLNMHGINAWKHISPMTLPLRKLKAYLKIKPWKSNNKLIEWQAACGILKGQSEI
jgi:glycosyltransferase involved in cell wall biosynthesis